ncbi:DUF4912 domain-containing protein [Bacillus sp. FJAT-52991]|uniref:DUF4912 domain-containing protein n=1 Tax=Bacillus kandeliae TaxID=3129297 RepID=A0ABZ2N2U0_9BACI
MMLNRVRMLQAEIIRLKNEGKSIQNIADILGISVGKVRYQWEKFQKQQASLEEEKNPFVFSLKDEKIEGFTAGFLTLTLTSPNRAICQWTLEEWFIQAIQSIFQLPIDQPAYDLRLYDVSDIIFNGNNAHHMYAFKVPTNSNYWFVKGLQRNRSYVCEIGFLNRQQDFFPLLRSNPIHTPYEQAAQQFMMYSTMERYRNDETKRPLWIEHISTYSYYEYSLEEEHE